MRKSILLSSLLWGTFLFASPGIDEFVISYWCGPPASEANLERYREVAQAGFNVAMPPISGNFSREENLHLLDIAKSLGLKCIILDARLPWNIASQPNWQAKVDEVIRDYSSHPAFYGYFITDEPNASQFPLLGEVVKYLKEKDPSHIAYINLFPDYATPEQLGTPTYKEHVEKFAQIVKPQLISFDYYPFEVGGDRKTFFQNLKIASDVAHKYNLPLFVIIQMTTHGPYRDLKEEEIRWQAFHSLAYGAKGIFYFTYWTPPDDPTWHFRNGIITWDGKRTAHYEEVTRINRELKALGNTLFHLQFLGAYHSGGTPPQGTEPLREGMPISKVEGSDAVLGFFRDEKGMNYCLIVNMSYKEPGELKLYFAKSKTFVGKMDVPAGKWRALRTYIEGGKPVLSLRLPPSGYALLRF